MRIIIVVLLMVSRDYHRSTQPSMRTVNERGVKLVSWSVEFLVWAYNVNQRGKQGSVLTFDPVISEQLGRTFLGVRPS